MTTAAAHPESGAGPAISTSKPRLARITVLMPMRNMERFVADAARSVLDQQGVEIELIVIDDGSTDRSRAVVESLNDRRIRIVDGPQNGISAALNAGLKHATGDFLCRCDSDDRIAPGRFARQVAFLQNNPEYGAVCGQFFTITARGRRLAEMGTGDQGAEITEEIRSGNLRTHLGTYLVRGDIARSLGFRLSLGSAEDLDFAFRVGESCRVWYEPRVEYFYRLHEQSITHTQRNHERDYYEQSIRRLQAERRSTGSDLIMRGGLLPPPPPMKGKPDRAVSQSARILVGASWRYRQQGRFLLAMWTGARACLASPAELRLWRNFAVLALRSGKPGRVA